MPRKAEGDLYVYLPGVTEENMRFAAGTCPQAANCPGNLSLRMPPRLAWSEAAYSRIPTGRHIRSSSVDNELWTPWHNNKGDLTLQPIS